MSVQPRALLSITVAALVLATLPSVAAEGADSCISVDYDQFAHGLSFVLSPAADSLTLGVKSGVPGDGVLILLKIKPSLCPGGFGVGLGGASVGDPRTTSPIPGPPPIVPLP